MKASDYENRIAELEGDVRILKNVINEYKLSENESLIIMQEQAKEIVRLREILKQIKSVAEFRLGVSDTANDVCKILTEVHKSDNLETFHW